MSVRHLQEESNYDADLDDANNMILEGADELQGSTSTANQGKEPDAAAITEIEALKKKIN